MGERTEPCFTPLSTVKGSDSWLLTRYSSSARARDNYRVNYMLQAELFISRYRGANAIAMHIHARNMLGNNAV